MSRFLKLAKLGPVLLFVLWCMTGCSVHKEVTAAVKEKVLVGEQTTDWLKYKVYLLPAGTDQSSAGKNKENLVLSIMVINMKDNTSPLRRLCTSLDDYNRYYEYLLNSCKNDIVLEAGDKELYPVYYAFENNYDAFPFETINVGFEYDLHKKGLNSIDKLHLVYTDKIFSQAVVSCKLNNPNK